jgi:hypothetical protein|tara:strand:+ start:22 stop:180 length:159 start_codon:yes stop_codon:yes gene_type:complete
MNLIQETWKLVLMQKMNFETTEKIGKLKKYFYLFPAIKTKLNLIFKLNQETV